MTSNGPRREKTCLRGFANNTGADQPAHRRSLISAFAIRVLKITICYLATDEITMFWLVSEAEENGLSLALTETPKKGFLATRPINNIVHVPTSMRLHEVVSTQRYLEVVCLLGLFE